MELVLILGFSIGLMIAGQIFLARWGGNYTRRIGDAHWQNLNENDQERAERRRREGYR